MYPWTLGELFRSWTLNLPWLKHVWYRQAPRMENRETIGSLNPLHWSLTRAWSAGLNTWAFLQKSPLGSTWVYITRPILSRLERSDEILTSTFLALPQGFTDLWDSSDLVEPGFFIYFAKIPWVGYYLLSSITHWGGLMYVFSLTDWWSKSLLTWRVKHHKAPWGRHKGFKEIAEQGCFLK